MLNLKFFPWQVFPPWQSLVAVTRPVLPLARLPDMEYRQAELQSEADQELQLPCRGCLLSVSLPWLAATQEPALHHRPGPQAVPSSAGWEVQM